MKKRLWQTVLLALSWVGATPAQDSGAGDAAKAAIELARVTLSKELNVDAPVIDVVSAQARTWPNSSMGCGKSGSQALQVITAGYEVILKAPAGNYRVHVSDRRAVVCGSASEWRNPKNIGAPLKNLTEKIAVARDDLAGKLGVPEAQIRTQNFQPVAWPDNSMGCAVPNETLIKQRTKGYSIALRYQGRVYTYHTDLDRVRACPAIELE